MAAIALDEKINKIKLQNEEIKRRHEEVEADKKNAAKLNALVQLVPSSDWPERKEPPEFSSCNRSTLLPKTKPSLKEHYYTAGMEGKVMHKFAEGDGPPPDPKYNFLADSERDVHTKENTKEDDKKKERNRFPRGSGSKKRGGGRDSFSGKQEYHAPQVPFKKEAPEYEAWRAERNRIDEARINRQKTAEGNWRREWDNNKIVDVESTRKDIRMKDDNAKDSKDYDKRYHNEGEYSNYGRVSDPRVPHSPFRNTKGSQDAHRTNAFQQHQNYSKTHQESYAVGSNDRIISGTNRNIKIMINQTSNVPKGPVMSVKVNSPSIVGTGRVGPRQKTKVTYSAVSEGDVNIYDNERSRFTEERHNGYKSVPPKSPYSQRKKEQSHPYRNESWKNDKGSHKRDYKDNAKLQKQISSHNNVPKWSGLQGRIERVRWDNAYSIELNSNADKSVVDTVNKLENEIKVVSEAEQFQLNHKEISSINVSQTLQNSKDNEKVQSKKEGDDSLDILQFKESDIIFKNTQDQGIIEKSEFKCSTTDFSTESQIETKENNEFKCVKEEGNIELSSEPKIFIVNSIASGSEHSEGINKIDDDNKEVKVDNTNKNDNVNLLSEYEPPCKTDVIYSEVSPVLINKDDLTDEVDSANNEKKKFNNTTLDAEKNENSDNMGKYVQENGKDSAVIEKIDELKISDNNFIQNLIENIVETVYSNNESTTKDTEKASEENISEEFLMNKIVDVKEVLDTSKVKECKIEPDNLINK